MNQPGRILLASLLLGAVAYGMAFFIQSEAICVWAQVENTELKWLREEFHLSDQQIGKIEALNKNYRPKCEAMCQKMIESYNHLATLTQSSRQMTPEIEASLKENAELQNECRQAMLEHVYSVSREMSPEQATRYVSIMGKAVLQPGHPGSTPPSR